MLYNQIHYNNTLCYDFRMQVGRRLGPLHWTAVGEAIGREHFRTDNNMSIGRSISAGEIGRPLLVRDGRETSSLPRG